ncbi:MAG: bifunctional oligoribonuclease/PAP phosphatase NrnA [Chloroflexota bacterium]|nr:bifunctional oligoribonuclease/PAP phosphatase NrnA [Chloroflexota bacterium]
MSAAEVVAAIRGARRITAICHENPDADTLGAAIAVRIIAERLGKPAEVVSGDPPPPLLSFLPRIGEVRRTPALEPDVAVIVDSGDLARIGSVATDCADWLAQATIVNIDHHVSNPGYGAVQLIDPEAAATCEVIATLLPELGIELDAELATVLMAGIVTDTHTFGHPNSTPRTLRVAADLVAAGAPLSAINRAVYVDKPYSTLVLWGLMLATIAQQHSGRIVHATMTLAMLEQAGADASASEGFIDLLASSRLAEITLLFKEADATSTKVSVRTTDNADAVAITSAFGGGGHPRAAGCTVQLPLDQARVAVLAESERELLRADARGR